MTMKDIIEFYPKNMNIKTFSKDCFDGATETQESVEMKEKYLKRFYEFSRDFFEDCIGKHIESISAVGFFFAWLYPEFVRAGIDVLYNYSHKVDGKVRKVYKFEKIETENAWKTCI